MLKIRLTTVLVVVSLPVVLLAQSFGNCSGTVSADWLDDGRTMKLKAPYVYTDQSNTQWTANTGDVIDGASIPRFLWSFIGGPFEGRYRKASVSHDVECDRKQKPWRDVHLMFYNHMMCSDVEMWRAKAMYYAVYHCGPRWGTDQGNRVIPCTGQQAVDAFTRVASHLNKYPSVSMATVQSLEPSKLTAASPGVLANLEEPIVRDPQWLVLPAIDRRNILAEPPIRERPPKP